MHRQTNQSTTKASTKAIAHAANTTVEHTWMDTLESRTLLASIASFTPSNGSSLVNAASNITVTFNEAMNASTLNASTVQLTDSDGQILPAAYSYNSTSKVLTIDPNSNLTVSNKYFTVRIIGGASGVKDAASGVLAQDITFGFTTGNIAFNDQTVWSGLTDPTALEFAPDGRVFVTEKRGTIQVYDNVNDPTPTLFADLRTQVYNYWDRGLLGLAIDPNFTNGRPYVYVFYTFDGNINGTFPKWGTTNTDSDPGNSDGSTTVSGRLSRLTVNLTTNTMVAGSEKVLVNDWVNQFPSHSMGAVRFGADGYLYASAGDGASFSAVDYGQTNNPFGDPTNEGGALRAQDIRSTGDPTGLDGTIIRIDPDTGAGAPGNPYSASSDVNAKRIIAFGLRNPFRFTLRPNTNEAWIGDVGWNDWEEINKIPSLSDSTAENFGWPAYEGNGRQAGYEAANLPLLQSLYASGGDTKPFFTYSHSTKIDATASNEPTGTSSTTGIVFYTGGSYPTAFDGALFFADYARGTMYVAYRGADGQPDMSTRKLFASGPKIVDLKVGPGGEIYYVDISGKRIGKLSFAGNGSANAGSGIAGTYIGTPGSFGNSSSTLDKVFDGDITSFFDAPIADNAWVGIDGLGPHLVTRVGFVPRAGLASRMVGGRFEASNTADFSSGVVTLGTIVNTPADSRFTYINVDTSLNSYRYFRYVSPAGGYGNIAELKFFAGDGISGTYYDNINNTGTSITRTDATPSFNWGAGTPDASIGADTFSARWTGKIQAIESGTYTFRVTADDGVRVWVNNVLLVDKYIDQSATTYTATIPLTAGQFYDIRVDYYENTGDASMQLDWARPGQTYSTIPQAQLFTQLPTINQAPVPIISTPLSTTKWKVGDTVTFSGNATDYEDGNIPASQLKWDIILMHDNAANPGNPHEHFITSFTGVTSGSFIAPDHEYPSWLEVRLTATDSAGKTTTLVRRIDPQTATVTLASTPTGATLALGSGSTVAPLTQTLIVGSVNAISAPASILVNGQTYNFTGWSDGGSLSHNITTPATNTIYTATYALPAAPTTPTNLVAVASGSSSVVLTWNDNAGNETGYRIERRISGGGVFATITTLGINAITYTDNTPTSGNTYDYRVTATGNPTDSAVSNITTVLVGSSAPTAPTDLAAIVQTGGTSVSLKWTDTSTNETISKSNVATQAGYGKTPQPSLPTPRHIWIAARLAASFMNTGYLQPTALAIVYLAPVF